jgi:N-acetylglucosaminyl-diphospho-decaprenol L-rhamnosyltransferase
VHIIVAIVAFRNLEDIIRCIGALQRLTYADYEVIICENGGEEAFSKLVNELPERLSSGQVVRMFCPQKNLGFAGGVNACIRSTPGAAGWWILNPDTEPAADALELLVNRLAEGVHDAIGCTVVLPNGQVQSYGGEWQAWRARAISIGHSTDLADAPSTEYIEKHQNYLNGAAMMVSGKFIEATGLMREVYFLYCEEVEWCLRSKQFGMKLGTVKEALVLHHVGTTTGNSRNIKKRRRMPVYLSERNRILLTLDCYPDKLIVALLSAFVMVLVKYGRRGAWRQVIYGLSGWYDGLLGKRGAPSWYSA